MKINDAIYRVMDFLRDNEQFGDDWSEEIYALQTVLNDGYKPEECLYVIDFYASAFFKIPENKNAEEYVEEHWEELVDEARYRLPESDYELYRIK